MDLHLLSDTAIPHSARARRKLTLLLMLVPYLAVELAFNHQLLTLSSGTLDSQALHGIEIWGRIISGVGLGLLLWTFVLWRLMRGLPALMLSLALGLGVMWHLQRMIVDHWVSLASAEDKQYALVLGYLSQSAASGALSSQHGTLMRQPADVAVQRTVEALFPAAALHAHHRDQLVQAWARQLGATPSSAYLAQVAPAVADNAYRNLIVPPLALGLSLLFALLNMAQLGFALIRFMALVTWHKSRWLPWCQPVLVAGMLAVSVIGCNAFVHSAGYGADLRPGMWSDSPVLAVLTEWSLRAEPRWYTLAEWVHRVALMNASFGHPLPGDI